MTNEREIKKPYFQTSFHGETWYKCPYCGKSFEYFDAVFGRGFKKTDKKGILEHNCGNLIDMRG